MSELAVQLRARGLVGFRRWLNEIISQNAPRLRNHPPPSRIETLRAKQRAKTEAKLEISRELITQHVAQLALHGKSEMVQLKAIEVLNKMQGYNEPASVQHNHVHPQVDAALIEELRAGHAALVARESGKDALEGAH